GVRLLIVRKHHRISRPRPLPFQWPASVSHVTHAGPDEWVIHFQLDSPEVEFISQRSRKYPKNRPVLRSCDGTAVALNRYVGRLQRPGQPLRCSAGASALPIFPAWLQGESKDLPAPPCTATTGFKK